MFFECSVLMVRTAVESPLVALFLAVSMLMTNIWLPAAQATILPRRGWNRNGLAANSDLDAV